MIYDEGIGMEKELLFENIEIEAYIHGKVLYTSELLTRSIYDDICYFKNATDVCINRDVECLEKVRDMALYDKDWRCCYS